MLEIIPMWLSNLFLKTIFCNECQLIGFFVVLVGILHDHLRPGKILTFSGCSSEKILWAGGIFNLFGGEDYWALTTPITAGLVLKDKHMWLEFVKS